MSVLVTVEVPPASVPLLDWVDSEASVRFDLERVVPLGRPVWCCWLRGDDRRPVVDRITRSKKDDVVTRRPDLTLLRWQPPERTRELFRLFDRYETIPRSVGGTARQVTIGLTVTDHEQFLSLVDTCRSRGECLTVEEVEASWTDADVTARLSEKQAEVVTVAFERGYFDVPRGTTMAELATEFDLSEQACAGRLRRGLSVLVRETVPADPET